MKTLSCSFVLLVLVFRAMALQPGDIIINEVYFHPKGSGDLGLEAVELLVVSNHCSLNGLQVTDRNEFFKVTEDQVTINDLGQGFLSAVPSGTLVVIYDGKGTDDTNATDFLLRFYVKSSLYCNAAPTGDGFHLNNNGDNVHVLHNGYQIDFVKYGRTPNQTPTTGEPGGLEWENRSEGYVNITDSTNAAGIRFIGDSPQLNDFLATWTMYTQDDNKNLGKPNGGRNSVWIQQLRAASKEDSIAAKTNEPPIIAPKN